MYNLLAMLKLTLIKQVKSQYLLDWHGTHGIKHWARVLDIGLRLARETGAKEQVIQLFALFHDCCRENEYGDPGHGRRGAELAAILRGHYFDLPAKDFNILHIACCNHTKARSHANITVQTCFDADRLDLGRVGKIPNPKLLCTAAAQEQTMIDWAMANSSSGHVPDNILGKI